MICLKPAKSKRQEQKRRVFCDLGSIATPDLGGPWVTVTGALNDYGNTVTVQSYTDDTTQGPAGGAAGSPVHQGGGRADVQVYTRFDYAGQGSAADGGAGQAGSAWTFGATAHQKGARGNGVFTRTGWSLSPGGSWSQGETDSGQSGWLRASDDLDSTYTATDQDWTHDDKEDLTYGYAAGLRTVPGPGGYQVFAPGHPAVGGSGSGLGHGRDVVTTDDAGTRTSTDQSYVFTSDWQGAAGQGSQPTSMADVITTTTDDGSGSGPVTGTQTRAWGAGFAGTVHPYDTQPGDGNRWPLDMNASYPYLAPEFVTAAGAPGGPRTQNPTPPTGTTATPPAQELVNVPVCFAAGTLVLMADGTRKPIERVEAGEQVLAASDQDPEGPVTACRVIPTTSPFASM